jgi:hypothetical protein
MTDLRDAFLVRLDRRLLDKEAGMVVMKMNPDYARTIFAECWELGLGLEQVPARVSRTETESEDVAERKTEVTLKNYVCFVCWFETLEQQVQYPRQVSSGRD